MSTVYFHLGMPKTGTTAIQYFLNTNNEVLKKRGIEAPDFGIRYADIGPMRNGRFLIGASVYRGADEKVKKQEKENYRIGLERIKELSSVRESIIFSDEGLWNGGSKRPEFWKNLKRDMTELGVDFKVIVYLRRQDEFLQSHWAQVVKRKGKRYSFREYCESMVREEYPLNYFAYLEHIAEWVGRENIIVRVYEKESFGGAQKTLISDFLDIFGLTLTEEFESGGKIYNTSLAGDGVELRRLMNAIPQTWGDKHPLTYALKEVQDIPAFREAWRDKTFFASQEDRENFQSQFDESNAAVAKTYLHRPDGRLFRSEIPHQETYEADALRMAQELSVLLARTVASQQEELEKMRRDTKRQIDDLKKELKNEMLSQRVKKKVKHFLGKK
ncbi:MAG: hypothetical protein Q4B57_02520 [Eubacteriales bacterium]|nr:hypothetical protein [Eubacteriales bacterium]